MAMPDPELAHLAWDYALIDGLVTPGLAVVTKASRKIKWDDAKGAGTSGATSKFVGDELSEFDLTLQFVDGVRGETAFEQRYRYQEQIVPRLELAALGKQACDFYYPSVSEPPVNVRACVPTEIGAIEFAGDFWQVVISFKQYRKPKPASGTPSGTKKTKAPTAKDAQDLEIEALTAQWKALKS
jgi:hypothetical protein